MKKERLHSKKITLLIGLLTLLLLGSVGSIFLMTSSGKSYTAYIYQNGELIKTIDLSTTFTDYEFTLENAQGSYNILTVKPRQIAVTDASCPDHICVNQGFIQNSLLPITCLPNKLVIQLKENHVELTPDTITY